MGTRRLIYVSRVARQVRFADAEAIATEAAVNNAGHGITGMLLYSPSHFIQVLEGDQGALDAVLSRIRADRRHDQLQILEDRTVPEREFGEWAMVAHRLPSTSGFDPKLITADAALQILRLARAETKA